MTTKNEKVSEPIIVEVRGPFIIPRRFTESAREWIDTYIGPDNGFQPWYPTLVIEPRFAGAILEGIRESGLEVSL